MRILVMGGTVFLGRHVAEAALARGHELTLFTRGIHGAELFPEAERIRGDRSQDVSMLRSRLFDAVIDTCGYKPADVAASAGAVDAHYVFVSSCNAYPGWPAEVVDEDSPDWAGGGPSEYGPDKVRCERAAEAALPGRVAAVRAGLIVGPHDGVFRLPWWVRRIAQGGDVPAPGDPARELQVIDARDLAAWMLDLAERRVAGVFNGTGPAGMTTMGELLGAAVEATGLRRAAALDPGRGAARARRRAVDRAAAVGARGRDGRDLADRHGAGAGGRAALPPGGRDGRRRRRLAARRRRGGAERLGLARAPGADGRRARGGAPSSGPVT